MMTRETLFKLLREAAALTLLMAAITLFLALAVSVHLFYQLLTLPLRLAARWRRA